MRKICIIIGVCLMVGAVALLAWWRWSINHAELQAQHYVHTLRDLMPEQENAVPEERRDNTMSIVSVDGTDFVGLIELPLYGSTLPVGADWGKTTWYPCRFGGSIYDGTMQIGATTQKGQFDFYRALSVGDTVFFTDAEGNRFAYSITSLRYEKHADQRTLQQKKAPLTLFIKNIYSFDYLIIFCDVMG
jgi:sortase A